MTDPVDDWGMDWDHAHPDWAADPFAILSRLRDTCPVARTERYGGAWMVTPYDLIDRVAHDPETFSSRETGVRPPGTNTKKSPPITSDPPEHGVHRRILLPAFAPRAILRLEDELRAYCRSLIVDIGTASKIEATAAYAQHIPTRALALLLALPDGDAEMFRGWVRAIMVDGHDDFDARLRATDELKAYLLPLVASRRGGDGDDVLTCVANSTIEGEAVDDDFAVGMAYLLVVAGIDTTWSALGTAIWHLGTHRDDLRRLVDDAELVATAVEEFLRMYAPVSVGRIATESSELGGCPIQPGDRVLLPFVSANRDPVVFERADEFVIDREVNRHAAFGLGLHRCLGSNLARLELRVAIEEFVGAFPRFRVDGSEEITWTLGHVRGPHRVPIVVEDER